MRKIYTNASKVLIWLGNDIQDVSLDLKSVRDYMKCFLEPAFVISLRGAWSFLDHPWFTRAWTLQEPVLAQRAVFHCGSQTLKFQDLMTFYHNSTIIESYGTGSSETNVAELCRVHEWYAKGTLGLFSLLLRTHFRTAKDPRDKIFSLLGCLHEYGVPSSLRLDYGVARSTLCARVARYCIETNGDMSTLRATGVRLQEATDLPSWVFDWRAAYIPRAAFARHLHNPPQDMDQETSQHSLFIGLAAKYPGTAAGSSVNGSVNRCHLRHESESPNT